MKVAARKLRMSPIPNPAKMAGQNLRVRDAIKAVRTPVMKPLIVDARTMNRKRGLAAAVR